MSEFSIAVSVNTGDNSAEVSNYGDIAKTELIESIRHHCEFLGYQVIVSDTPPVNVNDELVRALRALLFALDNPQLDQVVNAAYDALSNVKA